MEIIAHRGASHDAPENTLAAIHLAWKQRADAVEIDVQLSQDNRLVVIHDATTTKTAGVKKSVHHQPLAALRQLDVGRWKHRRWTGERIPTLAEALDAIAQGKRLFVEIKCGPQCVPELAEVFRRSGKKPFQLVPIGFAIDTMRLVKSALPQLEVCWVAQFKRSWKSGRWIPKPSTLIDHAKHAGLDGLDLGAKGPLTSALVEQVHQAGLRLYVWTVDAAARGRQLQTAGIDGITTNRPGSLRSALGL